MTILSTFTFAEIIGYFAAALVFLTFYIRMMVPLRIVGICSNCAFIAYAYLDNFYPVLILHLFLLPLNILRLHQMLQLSRQVREAASGDLNMAWVRPYSIVRCAQEGEVLFKKGDAATAMFVVVSGSLPAERDRNRNRPISSRRRAFLAGTKTYADPNTGMR